MRPSACRTPRHLTRGDPAPEGAARPVSTDHRFDVWARPRPQGHRPHRGRGPPVEGLRVARLVDASRRRRRPAGHRALRLRPDQTFDEGTPKEREAGLGRAPGPALAPPAAGRP
ncbi:hypothetical protein QJS66_20700 [Kocuria rhizophila]|nr:hypothetical protein QJS66_20700 [Kocuria rhizophila]